MKRLLCVMLAVFMATTCSVTAVATLETPTPELKGSMEEAAVLELPEEPWMLRLVSRDCPVEESFAPDYEAIQNNFVLDQRIAPIMRQMIADAQAAGVSLVVRSAYRPYSAQQRIYDARIQQYQSHGYSAQEAIAITNHYVAIPGQSEHQLGLAVDIATATRQPDGTYLPNDASHWLVANAPSYGFIQRYPANKSEITHTAFEPWHYRYVGKKAAQAIAQQGLCLEEYLEKLETPPES